MSGSAGFLGDRLGLPLAPLEAEPAGDGDRVDEDRLVAVEHGWIAEALADGVVVGLAVRLVVPQRRVGATDEHGEVAALVPGAGPDRVAGPALDGEIAGLQVEEQRFARRQRPQQRGLADAADAQQHRLDAAALAEPLVGGDDPEAGGKLALAVELDDGADGFGVGGGHHAASASRRASIAYRGLPSRTVRAGSNSRRIAEGHAPYARSLTS